MSRAQLAEAMLSSQLDSGERLLWSGQPRSGIVLRVQDAFLIPFSVLWLGFAVVWEVIVLSNVDTADSPVGLIFGLFGGIFVLIGLYFFVGRFIADATGRARTYYGITNDRIIIVSGLLFRQIKSLPLRTLSDVSLTQRANGSGTITFGPIHPFLHFFPAGGWPGARSFCPPSLDMIERAKDVYDTIRAAQKALA